MLGVSPIHPSPARRDPQGAGQLPGLTMYKCLTVPVDSFQDLRAHPAIHFAAVRDAAVLINTLYGNAVGSLQNLLQK